MTSAGMVAELIKDPTGRWAEFGKTGKPFTQKKLASLLDEFGIKPETMRVPGLAGTPKAYDRSAFEDAFDRYLPQDVPSQSATLQQVSEINDLEPNQSATSDSHVADRNDRKALETKDCCNVADCAPPLSETGGAEVLEDRTCSHCHGPVDGTTTWRARHGDGTA
jgi:hypothetical protein